MSKKSVMLVLVLGLFLLSGCDSVKFTGFSVKAVANNSAPVFNVNYTDTIYTTKDTFIRSDGPNRAKNYGNAGGGGVKFIKVGFFNAGGPGSNIKRGLLYFDLSAYSASDDILESLLELSRSPPGSTVNVLPQMVNHSWAEGDANGAVNDATINGTSWFERWFGNNLLDGNNPFNNSDPDWVTPGGGGDFVNIIGVVPLLANGSVNSSVNFTVTNMIRNLTDGTYTNDGIMLKAINESINGTITFYSKESSLQSGLNVTPRVHIVTPNRIINQTLTNVSLNLSLGGRFSDPDGNNMSYSCVNSTNGTTSKVTCQSSGTAVLITPAKNGIEEIRIRATDNNSAFVNSNAFNITVNMSFGTCNQYDADSAGCAAVYGCTYNDFMAACVPDIETMGDCNQMCELCTTQNECESTRSAAAGSPSVCLWETGISRCIANFTNFSYGGGTNANGGFTDLAPVKCIQNPARCPLFDTSDNYYSGAGESQCSDGVDNDNDGNIDCADFDCGWKSGCSLTNSSEPNPPSVVNYDVDAFIDRAFVRWVTNIPTNSELLYYNTSSNCSSLLAILDSFDNPAVTYDDYKPFHDVLISNITSANITMTNGTLYYFKLNGTDKLNRSYNTVCMNFTTSQSDSEFNFSLNNTQMTSFWLDTGSGESAHNFTDTVPLNRSNNVTMRMNYGGYNIKFKGMDLSSGINVDFNDAFFNPISAVSGRATIGISSERWQIVLQNLGADSVELQVPGSTGDIYKCDDNGTSCENVTDYVSVDARGDNYTNITLPVSLGFSTYTTFGDSTSTSGTVGGGGGTSSSPAEEEISEEEEEEVEEEVAEEGVEEEEVEEEVAEEEISGVVDEEVNYFNSTYAVIGVVVLGILLFIFEVRYFRRQKKKLYK